MQQNTSFIYNLRSKVKNELNDLKKVLGDKKLDSQIITNPTNIYYLTGFIGLAPEDREAILLVGKKSTLITAKLYQQEANLLKSKDLDVFIANERNEIENHIKSLVISSQKIGSPAKALVKVGFESNDLTYKEFQKYQKLIGKKLKPYENLIENLRIICPNCHAVKTRKERKLRSRDVKEAMLVLETSAVTGV